MGTFRLRLRLLRRQWRYFQGSIWFYPVLMAFGGLALFVATSLIDHSDWLSFNLAKLPLWATLFIFAGDASSAQSLLSTVAGMWATIIGISFSVTLVTTQLTATKYIAQVLPLFERNTINQIVLGEFLATVIYALLVLRTVRVGDADETAFVPLVGVNVAMVLAVIALFLLILFISNTINLVRPQYFMARTARNIERPLREGYHPESRAFIEPASPDELPRTPSEGALQIASDRTGVLTSIGWEELYLSAVEDFRRETGRGGRWLLYLHKQIGDLVERGEVLGHLMPPPDTTCGRQLPRWIRLAHEVQPGRYHTDDPDYGIESLGGLTIKGATQGDLDVAFTGVDYMFTLLPALTAHPAPATALRLHENGNELIIVRPVTDLLGKYVRELTLISEVALAPSLPFRQLSEGIGTRWRIALEAFAEEGDWERFDRLMPHLYGWYESAFYHMTWINGSRHLAHDLAQLALTLRALDRPSAFEAVLNMMLDVRDCLSAEHPSHEALREAFGLIAREADPPLSAITLMPGSDEAATDPGSGRPG